MIGFTVEALLVSWSVISTRVVEWSLKWTPEPGWHVALALIPFVHLGFEAGTVSLGLITLVVQGIIYCSVVYLVLRLFRGKRVSTL